MSDDTVAITLGKEEALVLFEILSRYIESDVFTVVDVSESEALSLLLAHLERVLVEPFDPNYEELLKRAKAKLAHD